MKYRLKDPEIDAALRVLFTDEEIDDEVEKQKKDFMFTCFCKTINKADIIEAFPYSPKAWNMYPNTKPPKNKWMRLMTHKGRHMAGYWDGECWMDSDGMIEDPSRLIKCFRPWEEE